MSKRKLRIGKTIIRYEGEYYTVLSPMSAIRVCPSVKDALIRALVEEWPDEWPEDGYLQELLPGHVAPSNPSPKSQELPKLPADEPGIR